MMEIHEIILLILSGIWITFTLLPLINTSAWWVRVLDYPRMQILILGMSTLLVFLITAYPIKVWHLLIMLTLVGCMIYQITQIFPFTIVSKKQSIRNKTPNKKRVFDIVISNVRKKNKKTGKLLSLIQDIQPDLFLTVENDEYWDEQLSPLNEIYPNGLKYPLDNTYGMSLYSKLELVDTKLNFYLQDDVPSIITKVRLRSGEEVKMYFIHPEPPRFEQDTDERDAEILMAGKNISQNQESAIIAGDLNDVGWSHTTWLFRKVSEMLDPRIGRGMFNTYNANIPFFRWPLDHVFHTDHFKLVRIERLSHIGSDHFPIHVAFEYAPNVDHEDVPYADGQEMEEANDKIRDGKDIENS